MGLLGLRNTATVMSTVPKWDPTQEATVEAWWKEGGPYTLNGSAVSAWNDSSGQDNHLVQATAGHQPSGVGSTAIGKRVIFDGGTSNQHMDTTSQITLAGECTIGMRLVVDGTPSNEGLIGDNTEANNFLRINGVSNFHIKWNNSATKGLDVSGDGIDFTDFDGTIVFTKDGSDVVRCYIDGVLITNVVSSGMSGDLLIDAVGIRHNHANEFGGFIYEIMLFNTSNSALTANVNKALTAIS